jgi:hypothetical protein
MLYPNRCQHLKINGSQCGCPALRRKRFCFFHNRFQEERLKLAQDKRRRPATIVLPVLEDANSIQVALMQVMRLLITHQIEHKTASLLLYALQTASSNLKELRLEIYWEEHIVDPREVANSRIGKHLWFEAECEEEEDEEEEEDDEESEEDDEETDEEEGDGKAETPAAKAAPAAVSPAMPTQPEPPKRPVSSAQKIRADVANMIREQMSGYGPFPKFTPPKR